MAKRKTIDVTALRIKVNDMLRLSTCSRDVRRGMMGVLETVLHETGNYRGFRYLGLDEVPEGTLPGIVRKGGDGTKIGLPNPVQENVFPDDSRVEYS